MHHTRNGLGDAVWGLRPQARSTYTPKGLGRTRASANGSLVRCNDRRVPSSINIDNSILEHDLETTTFAAFEHRRFNHGQCSCYRIRPCTSVIAPTDQTTQVMILVRKDTVHNVTVPVTQCTASRRGSMFVGNTIHINTTPRQSSQMPSSRVVKSKGPHGNRYAFCGSDTMQLHFQRVGFREASSWPNDHRNCTVMATKARLGQ